MGTREEGVTTCENHGLTSEEHCTTMEEMLFEVPADIREGERTPNECVKRLRLELEDAQRELGDANRVINRVVEYLRGQETKGEPALRRAVNTELKKYLGPDWERKIT